MESPSRTTLHDLHLASRKAEESALRRFQASAWLESFVGPIGFSNQPSEFEFVTFLKNGLVLCNVINKIQPGAVQKVIESNSPSLPLEAPPLLAYQYFENVRNFLVAVEELKLPAFEASDLETNTLEAGSTSKIVDCVLALKMYHEWKQWKGATAANGTYVNKHVRSPMVPHFSGRPHSQIAPTTPLGPRRHLDMSVTTDQKPQTEAQTNKHEDSLIDALTQCLINTKENIDHDLLGSFRRGNLDSVKLVSKIMSTCLQEEQLNQYPELKSILHDSSPENYSSSPSTPSKNSLTTVNSKCCKLCLKRSKCNHLNLLRVQERDLADIKALLSRTKMEFEALQTQFQSDIRQLGSQVKELSSAALGYQRVVKENRNLYNMVQDLKGNIRVYCRIRPALGSETRNVIDFIGDDGSLAVVDPLKPHKDARKVFQFNQVFGPSASQDDVFKDTQPLIRSVMDGYNVCIFAYGQTGSGKTHTMCGPSGGSAKDMGVNYLALHDLFNISRIRKDMNYEIRVQMVEIYNEQVRDLLGEDSSTTRLEIRNCANNNGLSLPDAAMHLVSSTLDVLNLMKLGETNRAVSSTAINNRSSRSHSVLTVHIQGKDTSGGILHSCLHLVDLAGSERVDKSEVTGDRLKEALYINKSLSCLGDVIMALAQKNSHIPYRNSKLTQLLQDSLGGHAKTLMFAHVSPEADSYSETVGTLKFAQRVSTVELGAARLNKENSEVRQLREQVEILKKALASKEEQTVQANQGMELRSPREKPKVILERTPPRPRRMSIENCSIVKTEKVMNSENKTIQANQGKELRSLREKPKVMLERTPPRPRRLSIENCSVAKTEKVMLERTPPRPRRLSIENCSVVKTEKVMLERTPPRPRRLSIENCSVAKTEKVMLERTPPRPRRLSIENCSVVKTEKVMNSENKKGLKTPAVNAKLGAEFTPKRARRLSLEGSAKSGKKPQLQIRNSETEVRASRIHVMEVQPYVGPFIEISADNSDRFPYPSAETIMNNSKYNDASSRSPTSAAMGKESRKRTQPVQLLKTPEPVRARNDVQIATPYELGQLSQTPGLVGNTTSKKGSHIRKSLQTIGKLINGSERRNHQLPKESHTHTPSNGNDNANDKKSPLLPSARTLRRQSLTGIQTSGLSRRSSLGGISTDSCPDETRRNAKTPPPVLSDKMTKRWF